MALAVPANAGVNWSANGEFGGGIGTSALSDSGHGCAMFGGTTGCWSNQTHISQAPTRLDGNFHVNALLDFGLRLQFDAEADRRFVGKSALFDPHEGVDRITTYGMGIHIDLRHDNFLVGALVSAGDVDASFIHNRVATYGFEGEWFLDRTTLFSQITHSRSVQGYDYWPQAWYLHVGARYFPLENLKLEVNAGKVLGQVTSDATVGNSENGGDAGQWGAKVEYRFGFMPLGLSLDYQGSYTTWKSSYWQSGVYPYPVPTNYSYDAHQTWRRNENLFMLRLHMYFGDESLIAGDHNGDGMNDYNPWYGEHSVAPAYAGDRYFVPIMPPL